MNKWHWELQINVKMLVKRNNKIWGQNIQISYMLGPLYTVVMYNKNLETSAFF